MKLLTGPRQLLLLPEPPFDPVGKLAEILEFREIEVDEYKVNLWRNYLETDLVFSSGLLPTDFLPRN
jgi:hypothetical protein